MLSNQILMNMNQTNAFHNPIKNGYFRPSSAPKYQYYASCVPQA
jgi:hypothetical protein